MPRIDFRFRCSILLCMAKSRAQVKQEKADKIAKKDNEIAVSVDRVTRARKSIAKRDPMPDILESFKIARDTRYEVLFDLKAQWLKAKDAILKNEMGTQIIILADKIIATDGRLADIGILNDLKAMDDNESATMDRWAGIFNKRKVEE